MAATWAIQFYNSAQWKALRKVVLKRDGYTCRECRVNRAAEVHHTIELTPDNIGNKYISLNADLLLSLCHDCHTKITLYAGDVDTGYEFDRNGQLIYRGKQ